MASKERKVEVKLRLEVGRLLGVGAPDWETGVARVFGVGAFLCGIIGLVVGVVGRSWKLGVIGWFTGGTLLTVLAILLLADAYVAIRRGQPS